MFYPLVGFLRLFVKFSIDRGMALLQLKLKTKVDRVMRSVFLIFLILINQVCFTYGANDSVASDTTCREIRSAEPLYGSNLHMANFLDQMKTAWDAFASERKRPSVRGFVRGLKQTADKKSILRNASVFDDDSLSFELKINNESFEMAIDNQKFKELIDSLSDEVEELSDLFPLINEMATLGKMGLMDILCGMPGNSVMWVERKLAFDDLTLTTTKGKKIRVSEERLISEFATTLTQLKNELDQIFDAYTQEIRNSIKKKKK